MSADAGLGRAVLELSTDDKKLTEGLERAKGTAKGIGNDFKSAGESAKGFGATLDKLGSQTSAWASSHKASFSAVGQAAGLVVGGIAAIGAAVVLLGQRGADVDDVTGAFNRLSDDGPAALGGLREGIGGLLTDYDLMKPMNAALSAGFKMNAADAYTMARAAWILSDAQGKDLKESYDTIAKAMATGKVASLGALGLNVELKGAALQLKAAMAEEGEAITSNAVKVANRQAAMEAMNRVVLAAGPQELDFGEKLTRVKVQIGNMTDSLGVAIATSPVLGAAMNAAGDALQTAFGANQTKTIQALVQAIGQIAIMAVQSATYVVAAAAEIASAYYKTRAAVDTLFQAFNDREIARVEGLVKTYEAIAATSTTATSASKLRLQELRIELERLKGVSKGFEGDANDSLATRDRLAAANVNAQKSLDDMIRSMQLAQAQGASATAIAKGLATANEDLAAGVHVATAAEKEQAKALADILAAAIPLTDAQKAAAVANDALGISAETTGKALGISGTAVKEYLDSLKTITDIAEIWRKAHAEMLDESKKFINKWLADSTAARQKDADASAHAIADQLAAAAEYHEKNYQLTLRGSALEIRQLELQRQAAIAKLKERFDQEGPIYDRAKAEIDEFYDHEVAAAKDAFGQIAKNLAELSSALHTLGTDLGGTFGGIVSGLGDVVGSFGAAADAAKAFNAAAAANDLAGMASGIMGIVSAGVELGNILAKITATAEHPGGLLGLRTGWLGDVVGTNNLGRQTAQAFADSMGGWDKLHALLTATIPDAEKLWKALSQLRNNSNPVEANAAIKAIQDAIASSPATAAAAGYQTKAQLQEIADKAKAVYDYMLASGKYSASELAKAFQASADAQKLAIGDTAAAQTAAFDEINLKYKEQLDKLDQEASALHKSISAEAEEAVMGVVETQERVRLAQIESEMAAISDKVDAEIAAAKETAKEKTDIDTSAAADAAKANLAVMRTTYGEGVTIPITFTYPDGMPGGFDVPAVPMARGGFGRITRPTLFYSGGNEDYAFSGEGKSFGLSALASRPIQIDNVTTLDGRVVARNQIRHMPNELARAGVRSR